MGRGAHGRRSGRHGGDTPPASVRTVTIDRTISENVRAQLRVIVKRILRKHGYLPDKQRFL